MSILEKASLIQIPSGYKNGKLYSVKPTPTFGSELVTNGDFSNGLTNWIVDDGTSWTNVNNTAFSDGNNGLITQNHTSTQNKVYKITFDTIATNSSGKELGVRIGGGAYAWNLYPTGTYTIYVTAGSTNSQGVLFYAVNGWTGSIDNVSVKEVLKDGDFDFSRSSSATRLNSEGLIETAQIIGSELVTNGDFSGVANGTDVVTLSGWGIYGSVTSRNIESEQLKLVSPSGTTNVGVVLSVSTTSGSLYRFTYSASGDLGVNGIYIDAVGGYNTSTEQNITFTAPSSTTYIYFRTGANNGGTAYFDNVSVKEVTENDVPRLDYSDGSCASLLLEGQSTNLINYSESLSNTNRSGTFVDNSAISPDGTQNATKITATSTDPFFYQSVTLNAATYTASLWVKGIGDSIGKEFRFAISNQTHISNKYTIPSEWTRFEFTASVSAGSCLLYTSDAADEP